MPPFKEHKIRFKDLLTVIPGALLLNLSIYTKVDYFSIGFKFLIYRF